MQVTCDANMRIILTLFIMHVTLVQQVCYMHVSYNMHVIDCNMPVTGMTFSHRPLTQQSDILKAGALKIKITCSVGVDQVAVISSSGC